MAAHQTLLSLGFSRQEHWSGLPLPSPMQESEKWKWSRSVVSNSSRPMDCSLPGSSIHGIFQARVLEWVATHTWCQFPGDQPWISKAIHHYVGIAVEILMLPRLWLPSIYVLGEQMQEWNNWLRQLVMCKVSLSWCNLWCIAPRSLEHAAFTPPALKFLIVFSICIATI